MAKIVRTLIHLPVEYHEWLRGEAFVARTTMSAIVRQAIQEYIERRGSKSDGPQNAER